ncbi:MAG: hypothetical protein WCA30_01210 [Dermatophilaceae bacterium]
MTDTALPQTPEITSLHDVPEPSLGTPSRMWVLAGIGAAMASIAGIVGSSMAGAVYDAELAGDAAGITDRMTGEIPQMLVFHSASAIAALLLVVFAAGLRRFLRERTPLDHLAPQLASTGLLLVSVVLLTGTALSTEFIFGLLDPALLVPETAVFYGHWIGTVPWFWAGAGLAALAVGVAGRRYGAVSGWLTWVSLVLGAVTTLLAVSPLQYMAGMTGPLWLLIVTFALLRER